MKRNGTIWVVGGDARQRALARLLAEEGCTVQTYIPCCEAKPEGLDRADCVILPVGLGNLPLEDLLDGLRPDQFLCGGLVDAESQALARARGVTIRDYFAREELSVANTVPTAEGALQIAMEELPITIQGAWVLVIGFGRVGKITAQRFAALGARVAVAARKEEQLAWARTMGMDGVRLDAMEGWLQACDLVVNTVPSYVLGRTELEQVREDCLILDLASKPGGVDRAAAQDLGRRVIHALALPAKVAPVTAAAALRDAIEAMMLEERGEMPERKEYDR